MMEKYPASSRKVDLYDIGDGLTLMNIVVKNDQGKIRRVDTYIGIEGEGFSQVAHADDLDQPGVIFSYSSHVKTLKANVAFLIAMFIGNMSGQK